MNEGRRAFLALFSLLFIAALGGFIALAWRESGADVSAGDWNATGAIATSGTARLVFTVICGALMAVGLVALLMAVAPDRHARRRESLRLNQADGSRMRITPEALEQLVRERLEVLPEVAAARPDVHMRGHALATDLEVAIVPGTNIAQASNDIVTTTMQAYRELVGVTAIDRPELSVRYADEAELRASNAHLRERRAALTPEPLTWEEEEARAEAVGRRASAP